MNEEEDLEVIVAGTYVTRARSELLSSDRDALNGSVGCDPVHRPSTPPKSPATSSDGAKPIDAVPAMTTSQGNSFAGTVPCKNGRTQSPKVLRQDDNFAGSDLCNLERDSSLER
jgi:hypothetical protein